MPRKLRLLYTKSNKDLVYGLFLGLLMLIYFWPVWVLHYRFPIGGGDLWGQLQPVWSFISEWLHKGVIPLWDPRMTIGDPIVAEGQYGLFNPMNWPVFLFSPIPDWIVTLRGLLPLWLAGFGLFLYLRHSPVWRMRRSAALIASIAYMYSDPFVAHLGHPHFNDAMALLPWVLLAMDNAVSHYRGIPWAGLALGCLLLTGHGQGVLYASLTVGVYALYLSLQHRETITQRLGRFLIVGCIAAGFAAPSLLPSFERFPLTLRNIVPHELRRGYEFPLKLLVNLITPDYYGRGISNYWASWNRVEGPYIGFSAFILACVGWITNLKKPRTWGLLLLAVTATLFALGYAGPIFPYLSKLPLFESSWKTSRAIFLLSLPLCISAGMGIEWLITSVKSHRKYWIYILCAAGFFLWIGSPYFVKNVPIGDSRQLALAGIRLASMISFISAGFSWVIIRTPSVGKAGLLLLLLAELTVTSAFVDTEPAPNRAADPHAASTTFLKADTGWFRVDVDASARGLWSPSAVQAAGFESPQGSGNPMELAAFSQLYWAVPFKGSPAYQLFGCKYIIVAKDEPPGGEGIWPVFTEDPLIDIHLNTNALTRLWLIYNTVRVNDIEQAHALILAEDYDPNFLATIENGPEFNNDGHGVLEVIQYSPNKIKIGVQSSSQALLVLSDMFYPGWQAYIDKTPAIIYRTNGIFRGVLLPEGQHIVTMQFFPKSLQQGLGFFIISILFCVSLVFYKQRRRQHGSHRQ